jgi:protocatechuate 3,4-dioxygenase alpha subunit
MTDKWTPREVVHRDYNNHPPAFAPGYKTSVLRSPRNALISVQNSLSEITGPVFSSDDLGPQDNDLILNYAKDGLPIGERIIVHGYVRDGFGRPMKNTLVEVWQANAEGRYNHPADRQSGKNFDPDFRGWGRSCSDFDSGVWRFETIKPGQVMGRDGRLMAPHVNLWIVARGINIGLNTRMYFSDEQEANRTDPVLNLIEWEVRRRTLIGQREQRGNETVYRFDIHLQGEAETVFFDL